MAVDVGANVGLFSILAARAGATVFAFEPNPPVRAKLRENLRLNGLTSRVHVDERGLFNREAAATLFDDWRPQGAWRNSGVASLSPANASGAGTPITTTTLDKFVEEHAIKRIDWIKMDIQGAEYNALKGGLSTLRTLRPSIVMELDPQCLRNMGWTREKWCSSWTGSATA